MPVDSRDSAPSAGTTALTKPEGAPTLAFRLSTTFSLKNLRAAADADGGVDVVVGHIAGQGHRHRDRILVGLEDIGRRLDLVCGDGIALGQIFQRGGDGFPAAEFARHAGDAHPGVGDRDLAVLQLSDLIEQQQRGAVETRRRAARQIHPVDDLAAAEPGARRLEQLALAGRQRRGAAQRHPDHIALGRPDERLGFGNEAGFVVNQPHARARLPPQPPRCGGPLPKMPRQRS